MMVGFLNGGWWPWRSAKAVVSDHEHQVEKARLSLKDRRMKTGNTKFSRNKQAKLAARFG